MNKSEYQEGLPFQGSTPISAHHSAEGAKAAAPLRAFKTKLYVDLLGESRSERPQRPRGGQALGVPNTSVNSIRNGLWPLIVPAQRRAESPYKNRNGHTLSNTCGRLATEAEQQHLREEKAQQDDVPF